MVYVVRHLARGSHMSHSSEDVLHQNSHPIPKVTGYIIITLLLFTPTL